MRSLSSTVAETPSTWSPSRNGVSKTSIWICWLVISVSVLRSSDPEGPVSGVSLVPKRRNAAPRAAKRARGDHVLYGMMFRAAVGAFLIA